MGSTIDDLLIWDKALKVNQLVSPTIREQMWMAGKLTDGEPHNYGFGWIIEEFDGRRIVHHGGGSNGLSTYMVHFPSDKMVVILMSNLAGFPVGRTGRDLARIVLGLPGTEKD